MNWKLWLHGLVGAAVTGASTAATGMVGNVVTGTPIEFKALGVASLGGGIVGGLLYLKQSPIPPDGQNQQNVAPFK